VVRNTKVKRRPLWEALKLPQQGLKTKERGQSQGWAVKWARGRKHTKVCGIPQKKEKKKRKERGKCEKKKGRRN